MTPICLTIKGLYSYQQETTIDFTHLTAAGLFGIFGAVGSGKSTLLEAISFALYGDTERLNSRESRSYNMMNLKSKDLFIDFEFESGPHNQQYKFTVGAKRNKKNFDDVSAFERKAYIYQNGWQPIPPQAESILGLSYANFKRTIIIPQGKFQEFLQLREGERVQMLKEIFNLEKYELGNQTLRLSRENDLSISHLQGQISALTDITPEQLEIRIKEVAAKQLEVHHLEQQLQQTTLAEQEQQKLAALFHELQMKSAELNALKQAGRDMEERKRKVENFEKCRQLFALPVDKKNTLSQQIITQQAEADKLLQSKKLAEDNISAAEKKLNELSAAYAARDILLQKADELVKISDLKNSTEENIKREERIKKGTDWMEEENKTIQRLNGELADLKQQINENEKNIPDSTLLVKISEWFARKNELDNLVQKDRQTIETIEQQISSAKVTIGLQLQPVQEWIRLEPVPDTLLQAEEKFASAIKMIEQEEKELQSAIDHLMLSHNLEAYAKALTDQTPCPLCGSLHHPQVYSGQSAAEALHEQQQQMSALKQRKGGLQSALVKVSGSYGTLSSLTKQYHQLQADTQQHIKNAEVHAATFSFEGFAVSDTEKVNQQLLLLEEKKSTLTILRNKRESVEQQIAASEKNLTKNKPVLDKLLQEKANYEGRLATITSQVVHHDLSQVMSLTPTELQNTEEALRVKYKSLSDEYEAALQTSQQETNVLAGLSGRIIEIQHRLATYNDELRQTETEINQLLITHRFSSMTEVQQVLSSIPDIEKEKQQIDAYNKQYHLLETQCAELFEKTKETSYSREAHDALVKQLEEIRQAYIAKNEQYIKDKHELADVQNKMQTRKSLQEELDRLVLRAENLKVLNNLFRSSGFVNFVSSVYLQNLVNSANERFYKMTRQKLMLELDEDNCFVIRDFMNNGQTRNVKTLSSGQTFQAALSLALALADNIQHLTRSQQNFFFLDEGFGSLDKDALTIVFDTLKNLKKENRVVGVISHVDEMQQEIPVNIRVYNDAETGSYIVPSWK